MQHGVCCESVLALRQMGWKKLSFNDGEKLRCTPLK
jgi:hypothetical protein